MVGKYDLSIITPAAPNRLQRVVSLANRFLFNKKQHPEVSFEWILVDDSLNRQYEALARAFMKDLNIKYIHLPLDIDYPNPAYMRNCGFRIAEGKVFCLCDVDWFLSENFVIGATQEIGKRKVLNTGYMIDTSKGFDGSIAGIPVINENIPIIVKIKEFNNWAMNGAHSISIEQVYKQGNIQPPKECNAVWMWSVDRESFLSINGYDEYYCFGKYSREDDDLYFRLKSLLPIHRSDFMKFCGVHLWHSQAARGDNANRINREYFDRQCNPVREAVRNKTHEWGKLVENGFSIINETYQTFYSHELWISDNIRIHTYNKAWKNFDELRESVKCESG